MSLRDRVNAARQRMPYSRREALSALLGSGSNDTDRSPPSASGRQSPRTTGEKIINSPIGAVLFRLGERTLLFEPDYPHPDSDPDGDLKHPSRYGLPDYRQITLNGPENEHYTSWYKEAQPGYPTFAYCHGNSGGLELRAPVLRELSKKGFGVMIVAYPGFKGSKENAQGKRQHCSESGSRRAARTMVATLQEHFHIPPEKLVLFGESLGGAIALGTALEMEQGVKRRDTPSPKRAWKEAGTEGHRWWKPERTRSAMTKFFSPKYIYTRQPQKPAAVICLNAFVSMAQRVKEESNRLPVEDMENRLDSGAAISKLQTNVLLLQSTKDEITGPHHSEQLKALGGDNVTLHPLIDATHRLTDPQTGKIDPEQVTDAVHVVQEYLAARQICPHDEDYVPSAKFTARITPRQAARENPILSPGDEQRNGYGGRY